MHLAFPSALKDSPCLFWNNLASCMPCTKHTCLQIPQPACMLPWHGVQDISTRPQRSRCALVGCVPPSVGHAMAPGAAAAAAASALCSLCFLLVLLWALGVSVASRVRVGTSLWRTRWGALGAFVLPCSQCEDFGFCSRVLPEVALMEVPSARCGLWSHVAVLFFRFWKCDRQWLTRGPRSYGAKRQVPLQLRRRKRKMGNDLSCVRNSVPFWSILPIL